MGKMNDLQLMVQVSKMYYLKRMTQAQIAKEVGISRPAVSILLSEAMKGGLIEIKIKDPSANNDKLSRILAQKFSLKECRVVPTTILDENALLKIVASQAVGLAKEAIENGGTLGIAWGKSCYAFMQAFPRADGLFGVDVVPLTGGSNLAGIEFQLNETVRMFAEKLNGTPHFIYAPAMVETAEDKAMYMQSTYMGPLVEKWKNLDLAVITAGRDPAYRMEEGFLGRRMLEDLIACVNKNNRRPVGDMCALHFDITGAFVDEEHNDVVIGVGKDNLMAAGHVLCVASGLSRVLSVIGALNTGVVDILVIDENTAKTVLEIFDDGLVKCLV
ncbi:MAG TPA: hypothetical protein DEB31_02385 [Clostridiales bacterium]|nr:hypothetical protein [Clostridiales bacterium]